MPPLAWATPATGVSNARVPLALPRLKPAPAMITVETSPPTSTAA